MKLLFIHSEYFNYQLKEETELAEKIDNSKNEGSIKDSLIVFLSVERRDEEHGMESEKLAEKALNEIEDIVSKLKVEKITLFPFAHLSENLSSPTYALSVIENLEKKAENTELKTLRVPFGWYKEFEFKSKGHPLSVLSRTIRPNS